MHSHREFWFWTGAALTALALTLLAIAGSLLAARSNYQFWGGPPMIGAYVCGALAIFCLFAAVRDVPFPFVRKEPPPQLPQVVEHDAPATQVITAPEAPEAPEAPHLIFDEAPPELADMTPDSLRALLAGRTTAQIHKLMEQHRGKAVRVVGEVEHVELGLSPSVRLKAPIPFLLFFDTEGYDAESVLLTLNSGEKIVASGQIRTFEQAIFLGFVGLIVSLDRCRLVEAWRIS